MLFENSNQDSHFLKFTSVNQIFFFKKIWKKIKIISAIEKKETPKKKIINPLTLPGEGVTVFTSPYLSAGALSL